MINTNAPDPANPGHVFWGLTVFLSINFLVAAMYFKILNI